MVLLSKFSALYNRYPLVIAIASYGVLWPSSSIIQQTFTGHNWENYDWKRALRFSIWGACFVAPTYYGWIRLTHVLFPVTSITSSIKKVVLEQCTYGPMTLTSFFFGMSLLEGKSIEVSVQEVKNKFIPTYKVGICFWPIFQTLNYSYVGINSRAPLTALASVAWTCFLAYMHEKQLGQVNSQDLQEKDVLKHQ